MPKFDGKRERNDAHFFDTIKKAGEAHLPLPRGRLFVEAGRTLPLDASEEFRKLVEQKRPASDVTFLLDGIQIEFQGRGAAFPALRDGVKFELFIAERPWPIRAVGEEGIFGPKFVTMKNGWPGEPGFNEVGAVYIPARQSFHVNYELTDEALRILGSNDDTGIAIHLFGKTMRDVA